MNVWDLSQVIIALYRQWELILAVEKSALSVGKERATSRLLILKLQGRISYVKTKKERLLHMHKSDCENNDGSEQCQVHDYGRTKEVGTDNRGGICTKKGQGEGLPY